MNHSPVVRWLMVFIFCLVVTLLAAGTASPETSELPFPQPETWTAGQTSVSELSPSAFKNLLGVPPDVAEWEKEQAATLLAEPADSTFEYPERIDWRSFEDRDYTTAIRNQFGCGSCVAFGTIAAIESRMEITANDPDSNPDLSEDHLFFCSDRKCYQGWWPNEALEVIMKKGVVDESCQPYEPTAETCDPCPDWEARVKKIANYRLSAQPGEIKHLIANDGPVIAVMKVYDDFAYYQSGIYTHVYGTPAGLHCVAIVGYDDTEGYWIAKNSWGTGWGENGWFRVAYGEVEIDNLVYVPEMFPATGNQAPITAADTYYNPTYVVAPGVLANDNDPDGLPYPLTADLESDVSHGSLELSPDGSFHYTADDGFTGSDEFTYRAYDGDLYSLETTVTIEVTQDPFEPNDSFSSATEIDNPAFLLFDAKAIDPAGDLDYFRFSGRAGDKTSFYLYEDSPLEAVLTLYDANLSLLAEDNDVDSNDDGVASFDYELPDNGDYYLRVKDNRHPAAGGDDYVYSLSLHLDEPGEPNDDFSRATPMTLGEHIRAYLFTRFGPDFDIYVFDGLEGAVVHAGLWPDTSSDELDLCLFAPNQTELVCDDPWLDYEIPANGSYYLQVTGHYPGNYTLYLWQEPLADVYEPNDDRLQATPVELNTKLDAELQDHNGVPFWQDKDYYQFTGQTGYPLVVIADSAPFGSYVDPNLTIEDANGDIRAVATDFVRTELEFTLPSAGIYYLLVSADCGEGGVGCQGGYQLLLQKANESPKAVSDGYTMAAGTTLIVAAPGVLVNDIDVDGDDLTAVLVSDVQYGELQLLENGALEYKPQNGFYGLDVFTYQANDGDLNSGPTFVLIEVQTPRLFLPAILGG